MLPLVAPDPDLLAFAENLRAARANAQMSQMDLGRACNVHPTVIARIEMGQREPRLTTITKLARGLEITTSALLQGI